MSLILNLFLKDARRLWPQALAFILLLGIRLGDDPYYGQLDQFSRWRSLLDILKYLALWALVVLLIQQDRLIGDRQYWLTRPMELRHLLAAKILFILSFIFSPLFIGHLAVLTWLGFPLSDSVPILLVKDAIVLAILILPAAALAAITASLAEWSFAAILSALAISAIRPQIRLNTVNWGEFAWIHESLTIAIVIVGACLVLAIQYLRHRTRLAMVLSGATVLAAIMGFLILPAGSWCFSIQKLLSRQHIDRSAVQISLDSIPRPLYPPPPGVDWSKTDPCTSLIRLPIQFEKLPAELGAYPAASQILISAGASGEWRSGWYIPPYSQLRRMQVQPSLMFAVDTAFYKRVKHSPVQVSGFVDLTVVKRNSVRIEYGMKNRKYVPGAGVCYALPSRVTMDVEKSANCLTPWPRASVSLDFRSKGIGAFMASSDECAPWPITASLTAYDHLVNWQAASHITYAWVATRPVAHIRRHVNFENLRLSDYLVK
jgi:hypothetical protein